MFQIERLSYRFIKDSECSWNEPHAWYIMKKEPLVLTNLTASTTTVRDIEITSLKNGVRVITEVMPHVRSVSVGVWVGTGSRRESPERCANAWLIVDDEEWRYGMLYEGTARVTVHCHSCARAVAGTAPRFAMN